MLLRFRQGERDAFEWLVRQYLQSAVRFAYHLTGDYHAAEDLAQDCFAYLLVYPDKYDYRASFKTYLFTILRNKSIDALRKKQRSPASGAGLLGRSFYPGLDEDSERDRTDGSRAAPGDANDPERAAIVREEDREWRRRLLELKPDYRHAVYLVDMEQLSYAQAAAIMRRNTVTFKVLLHRARKKLRQIYEKEERNGEANRAGASVSG
ncbi:RNA polymerase sigma factor [Cohnella boryungensis]|uniref:RNA polymerase sigma factor n=1 Tax=Cohnella boryungensis TaxID=768479 RepID=A0ABV8SC64_9BACL